MRIRPDSTDPARAVHRDARAKRHLSTEPKCETADVFILFHIASAVSGFRALLRDMRNGQWKGTNHAFARRRKRRFEGRIGWPMRRASAGGSPSDGRPDPAASLHRLDRSRAVGMNGGHGIEQRNRWFQLHCASNGLSLHRRPPLDAGCFWRGSVVGPFSTQ